MSKPIIFSENSPLLPVTRQKVDKLRKTLINDKLTPWRWFNFHIVDITDFYGKPFYLGGKGTSYGSGTEVLVFFSFIKPFLEDAIIKIFDETIETCRVRGLKPVEPYIREAAMLLEGHLIYQIYDEIVDIDQHLRGKGNPKSVGRRNVIEESAEMRKILVERKDEIIRGINEQNKLSGKKTGETDGSDIASEQNLQAPEGEGAKPMPRAKAKHSIDFRSVHWFGTDYTFTPNQAAAIKILWEAWENGIPDVGGDTLAVVVESDSKRARDIFKGHLALGSMICPGQTKGTYRLVKPDK